MPGAPLSKGQVSSHSGFCQANLRTILLGACEAVNDGVATECDLSSGLMVPFVRKKGHHGKHGKQPHFFY